MRKITFIAVILLVFLNTHVSSQDDYLKITTNVSPGKIKQGEEGILKIKVTPKDGIKISSHPEFMIKLDDTNDLIFSKVFFTAGELDFQTKQEKDTVFLDLEKEIEIPFKLKENSLIGKHRISGEIIFTAVFKDHWSLKTFQKFFTAFTARRNNKTKKR